jgi:hypothetical protein
VLLQLLDVVAQQLDVLQLQVLEQLQLDDEKPSSWSSCARSRTSKVSPSISSSSSFSSGTIVAPSFRQADADRGSRAAAGAAAAAARRRRGAATAAGAAATARRAAAAATGAAQRRHVLGQVRDVDHLEGLAFQLEQFVFQECGHE